MLYVVAAHVNRKNARSRMGANFMINKHIQGQKKSQVLGTSGLWVSPCYGPFLLSCEPFFSLIFISWGEEGVLNH